MPRISVVIPAYNAAATLRRALESVFRQTVPLTEIIVVDDASRDAVSLGNGVRVLRHDRQMGAAAARNTGIRAAVGDWIAFLDADDEWLPQKLERQCALCVPGTSLVFCASEEFASDGSSMGDTFRGRPTHEGVDAWKALLQQNFVSTPTVLAPRELLLKLGGFDERLRVGEDQDLWVRLARAGRLSYVAQSLARIHVQPASLSAYRAEDHARYVLPMIMRHVKAFGAELSDAERRAILGERLGNAGRIALCHGALITGSRYLLRAALLGHRPLRNLAAIVKTPLFHRQMA
ncbi:glycosyltransferase involved in cell wall biosynthesis [Rhizomicrobium palustre]|uniref:Glycosyltransferase involved in cell wall biosynthesis n=1 Tax=Rhizomicrobium palustre TaxID=189966 RepID=A0A846MU38_9PROT|nr:glycosyltransferase [Rhizomicrobium palustre]NIK86721.1 glycosyltransferase involved in cell wall biosynthesis [Rhizomicrobium palustre]